MSAAIALPRLMRIGSGAAGQLSAVLAMLGLERPLLMIDPFLKETAVLQGLIRGLEGAGMAPRIFADTIPEPTVASVEAALAFLQDADHDCVVAIGGGSPIDTAKAVAVLSIHGGRMSDYKVPHQQDRPGLPIIAIPTTAGTGSEATRTTVITDQATDEKMVCLGLAFLPVAALVDFELTLTKPARLTADTGLDALTHAIEAYVSRKANPFSDAMALAAMRLLAPNLRRAFRDGGDRAAREAMMLGASQAGMAFSNSSIALVHGMSRPIGAHFHIAHGLSNAMLLPTITAYSAPAAVGRYADCARAMALSRSEDNDHAAVSLLIDELRSLNRDLQVPSPKAYGIDENRWTALIPLMAQQALASGSPGNNPRLATPDDIEALYREVWAG